MPECALCSAERRVHHVPEMHDGSGELFRYAECPDCGHLELLDVPQDLAPFYKSDYYAHRPQGLLKSRLKAVRAAHAFGRRTLLSSLLVKRYGYPPVMEWLQRVGATPAWRILDVGCGEGIALRDLDLCGFRALHGVDPFLTSDRQIGHVKLTKKSLFDVHDTYDFIVLNHSFEHMGEQGAVLAHLERILSPGGWLLIRMPTIGNAWRTFGVHWYALDAPRHLSIHSLRSFARLTQTSPFVTRFVDFDTDGFHYLASQQYVRGVPLIAPESYMRRPVGGLFSPAEVAAANAEAERVNRERIGDQASFYLQKKTVTT